MLLGYLQFIATFFFLESQIKYMYNKRILILSFEEYR